MAVSVQLIKIFALFCISITNADYSSLAHWITTSDYLENNKFKDLSTNNNGPFESSMSTDGSITDGTLTCGSFLTPEVGGCYYGVVQSLDASTTTEYGVSVWLNIPTGYIFFIFSIASSKMDFNPSFRLHSTSSTVTQFKTGSGETNDSQVPRDKWAFVVFYFKKNNAVWDCQIISPEFTTVVFSSYASFPGKYINIGFNTKAYYYEIQAFTKAEISTSVVTLYDSAGATLIAIKTSCPNACSGGYCHSEIGCLQTSGCCPSVCYCSAGDTVCTSCKDTTYGVASTCKCKNGFILDGDKCVFGNFYTDGPAHCVDGTSKTVCTQCESTYFLYDDSPTSTICLGCDSCDTCSASPNCYVCAKSIVQDGSTCRVDSIGYQLSFSSPNIIIDFAHPLSKTLKMNSFKATTDANEDIPTTGWAIDPSSTSTQYQVVTNLVESQLPINLSFAFEQQDS